MSRMSLMALALCSAMLPACVSPEEDLDQLLRDNGFTPLTPPNQIDGPGAVIRLGENDEILSLVCTSAESVGAAFQASVSPTTSITFESGSSGGASIKGKLYDLLTADIDAKLVAGIKASLTNTYDIVASEAQIRDAFQTERTPGCSDAIANDKGQGQKLAIITEAYRADYTINITFSATADIDAQIQISDKLTLKLGITAMAENVNQITGTGLFWGFKKQPL